MLREILPIPACQLKSELHAPEDVQLQQAYPDLVVVVNQQTNTLLYFNQGFQFQEHRNSG